VLVAVFSLLTVAGELVAPAPPPAPPASEPVLSAPAPAAESPSKRHRPVVGPLRRGILELKDPADWPAEPATPGPLDAPRFDEALVAMCAQVTPSPGLPEVARLVREAAAAAGQDPFLLAALAYRQSWCRPGQNASGGIGLLGIQPSMFERGARLPFPREALARERLTDAAYNLQVGTALLAMWEAEHPALDQAFPGTPHRTGLAHFIWGDRVWGAAAEDRTLTARRVLIEAYERRLPMTRQSMVGLNLVSPLDGTPRLASSGPGADREGGAREHRGLDIDAAVGEPVRAVADGVVQFAGVDLPGRAPARWLPPTACRRYRYRTNLGPGGLFVRIVHADGLRTGYFHLSSFSVVAGQAVRAGEIIGSVGRSGIKVSNSHLHFEVQREGELYDPARVLGALVIPPEATVSHDVAMAEKQERLDRQRRARYRAWLKARRPFTSMTATTSAL
jgi:murein DD-endopeptidase MepM/ murein hydrolase activator NlpD